MKDPILYMRNLQSETQRGVIDIGPADTFQSVLSISKNYINTSFNVRHFLLNTQSLPLLCTSGKLCKRFRLLTKPKATKVAKLAVVSNRLFP